MHTKGASEKREAMVGPDLQPRFSETCDEKANIEENRDAEA
jgi:hypothetical protein